MSQFAAVWIFCFLSYSPNVESLTNIFLNVTLTGDIKNPKDTSANCSYLPFGTTSCSSYPHVLISKENVRKICYVQRYYSSTGTGSVPYKCRCNKNIPGVPVANIALPVSTLPIVKCLVSTGDAYGDSIAINDPSKHVTYKIAYVQTQTGERISISTSEGQISTVSISVFPYATDMGYVNFICNAKNLNAPICSAITAVFVCTYERNASATDIEALVKPLRVYPYFFGNNFFDMDQTDCGTPILDGGLSDIIDAGKNITELISTIQTATPLPNVITLVGAVGTTACSTFTKIDEGIKNFRKECFIQRETPPQNQVAMKCKTKRFTVTLEGIPLPLLNETVLSTGIATFTYKTPSGDVIVSNSSFVETQSAVVTLLSFKKSLFLLLETQAIVYYTDKGYVFVSCNMSDLQRPLCAGITYAGVCTYARNESVQVISELMQPLNKSPFTIAGSFVIADQTNC